MFKYSNDVDIFHVCKCFAVILDSLIYWLLMTFVNVSIHLHNPQTTVCDLKSNYQTSGNILLCVFQLQSVISLICLKEKSSQKTLGCHFQDITEKSNQLLGT